MDATASLHPVSSPAGAMDVHARFEPGTVVAGNWRITRQLGAMRLDETYEAQNVDSSETVALRVIRRDDGRDDATFRRFTRVARRLSSTRHPNVQHVIGLATHQTHNEGTQERVLMLVTEVLSGESLTHRVRRTGPLEGDAAKRFVDEICEGLDAIHRRRVLHGDITGASVVFVEAGDGSERAVLTDLAFLSSGEGDDHAIARAVGSPAYRAPEQLTGRKLHRASDIFSLGAVIYEALTARLPFTGGNLLALDFRQLEEEPRPPAEIVPGLDPNWTKAILRCLERAPESRFERATDVLRAMQGETISTPRFRQSVRTLGAASLLITLMIGGSALLSWVSFLEDRRLGVERVFRSRPSVAVMPIRPDRLSERDAWIAVATGELLRLALARDDSLRVTSRDAVSATVADLDLHETETLSPEALYHIRTLAGAEQVVIGSCRLSESAGIELVTLDLCLQDARTGETVGAVFESGPRSELPELAARVVDRIRPNIGSSATQKPGSPKVDEWTTAGLEAYSRGLVSLEGNDAEGAVSALRLAATTDADNPTVRLALSQAWWISGDLARATDEAKRAWDASEGLSSERLMELELRHAELRSDRGRVMEVYRRLIRTYPDRIDHGLGLVGALIRAREFDEARRALRSMRSAVATPRDPRIELFTARLESQSGRYAEALAAAGAAAELAAAIGARGNFAEALVETSWAAAAIGDLRTAATALDGASEAFRARGDLDDVARMAKMRASLERQSGRPDAALASLRESERIYTAIGQRQGVAATRSSIGLFFASRGQHRDAAQELAAAVDGFVAIGDEENAIRSRLGLAESLTSLGALASAEAHLRAALATSQARAEPMHRGLALLGLARIETERGNIPRSRELLGQSTAAFEASRFGEGLREAEILRGINTWLAGDEREGRQILLAAKSRALNRGDRAASCRAALPLSRIDMSSGNAAAALASASMCAELLATATSPAEATSAMAVAAQAALRLGDRARAGELVAALAVRARTEEDFVARASAEIAIESMRGASASKLLQLAASAADASMTRVELDALLGAAEIATHRGDLATRNRALARAEELARRHELVAYTRLIGAARASTFK